MTPHQLFSEWSQWFWPTFANHLWQATLFTIVVWVMAKAFDRAPARFRYYFWLVALGKFLVPSAALLWALGKAGVEMSAPFEAIRYATSAMSSIVSSLVSDGMASKVALGASSGMSTAYAEVQIFFQMSQPATMESQTAIGAAATSANHAEIYCMFSGAWLLGASALVARWVIQRRRFARSMRGDQTITSGREFDALERARSWLFLNREIRLVISPQVRGPGVWRIQRPTVVFPEGVADRLNDDEITAVMTHEVIHVWRRDNLIGALQMAFCSLLWFHPLVWLIDRRLSAEREMWCDETVIRFGAEPRLYATSLWKVAQFGLGWPVAGVSSATGSNLKRRIERMLKSRNQLKTTAARRAAAYGSVIALALLSIAVGLLGNDNSAFAQRNKIETTDKKELAKGVYGGIPGGIVNGVKEGVVGGAPNGVAGGVSGGISGGVGRGPEGGVPGGVNGGLDGEKNHHPMSRDNKDEAPPLRQDKWEAIKQAPEYAMRIENQGDEPLLITDARVKVLADQDSMKNSDPDSAISVMAQFKVTLMNQTNRVIKGVILEFRNPGLSGEKFQLGVSRVSADFIMEPHGAYTFGMNMLHHHRVIAPASQIPSRFTVAVATVKFETEPHWGQVEKNVQTQPASDPHSRNDSSRTSSGQVVRSESNQVQPMSASMRPTILYREKAQYTQEAKDNQIEGTVVLRVVFGADAQIKDIEVINELPHGLTENAIEATKKIRFEPATKDGRPVSVRGNLEYFFRLD